MQPSAFINVDMKKYVVTVSFEWTSVVMGRASLTRVVRRNIIMAHDPVPSCFPLLQFF